MSETLEELPKSTVSKQVFSDDVVEKAEKLSYFVVDKPSNASQGLTNAEYNFIKGAAAGTTMLFTAPFIGAYEESKDKEGAWEITKGVATGLGKGTYRGVVGGAGIAATSVVVGTNQLREGLTETAPEPGQGRNWKEHFEHIVSTPYTQLCSNTQSESFQADVEQLIAEGAIPAVKRDHEGKEVPYQYQFFITEEPKDLVQGVGYAQYNAVKGFVSGAALVVSAPFIDSVAKYNETNERGEKGGFEGAVQGFGAGLARGVVGGFMLLGSGLAYGGVAAVKGLGNLNNITKGADLAQEAQTDYSRLYDQPVLSFVYQKGHGLEEYIVAEEERVKREAEEKAAFEEAKAEWYRTHPGEVHESDKPAAPISLPSVDVTSWLSNPFASSSSSSSEPTEGDDVKAAGGGVVIVGEEHFDKPAHGKGAAQNEVASQ